MDGVLVANETIDFLKRSKKRGLIFKVDFEKAYDSVEWAFLLDGLENMGFGVKWRNWIKSCLNSARISILVNGSPTREFPMEKGLEWGFIEARWEGQSEVGHRLRFEVEVLDEATFADGSERLEAEGTSPVRIFIAPELVSGAMQEGGHRIRVTAHPAQESGTSAAAVQPFDVFAQLVYFHPAGGAQAHSH